MEYEFKVGQKVYDSFRFNGHEGIVEAIGTDYIRVSYPSNSLAETAVYTKDRRYMPHDAFPTLYPFPYEIEVKEVQQFQKGDLVLWRNNEGHPWNIGIYREYSSYPEGLHNIRAWGQFETFAKFVIPFKNNEHRLWKRN